MKVTLSVITTPGIQNIPNYTSSGRSLNLISFKSLATYSMEHGRLVCPAQERLGIPALFVHDLTGTADARRLLNKPPLIHPATPDILPRICQWNPEIASKLADKDGAVKSIPFKLVTTNRKWVSQETNSFVAASYCWHNDEWTLPSRFNPTPENWSFPISLVMVKAMLCHIENGEAIWLDQLCIEQNDLAQKAHAIANMDTIYRNAREVVVLLEDLDMSPEVEQLLTLLATTPVSEGSIISSRLCLSEESLDEYFLTSNTHDAIKKSLLNFMFTLFDCRWFTRAWCFQEYQLNPIRTFVTIGHVHQCVAFRSEFFRGFQSNLAEADIDICGLDLVPEFQRFSFGIGLNEPNETRKFDVFNLFVELERMSCQYWKDIVSIALNTSGIFLSFDSDVNSETECRLILSLILVAAGDLRVLDTVGPPICKRTTLNHQAVIRWPNNDDFRYWRPERAIVRRPDSQLKFRQLSLETITLDLFLLRNQPRLPTEESMDQATAYWMASGQPSGNFWPLESSRTLIIASLACALGLGSSWMVQTINDMNGFLQYPQQGQSLTEDASRSFVAQTRLQVKRSIPEVVLPFLRTLESHFRHVSRTIPLEIQLKRNSNHNAILFVSSRLKQYVENATFTFHIAVPAALNTKEEAYMRRVWILEDAKTVQPALSIVAQGYLLGKDLTMDCDVSYVENISVVGRQNNESDEYDSAEEWEDWEGSA